MYGGQSYRPGDSFPATDGCNTCSCNPDGQIACTLIACAPDAGVTCMYNGRVHQVGDSFAAVDGCNTCSCLPDATVACTEIACPVDAGTGCAYDAAHYAPGESFLATDGCNMCSCLAGGTVGCTKRACSCALVKPRYDEELARIRMCTAASDCGQVLQGTSCGCTRNLVARKDAVTTDFYRLLNVKLAGARCVEPPASTCDCPPVAGFACEQNTCTWNYIRP